MAVPAPEFLPLASGTSLAYRRIRGQEPGLVWLGGFKSDMLGTKAEALSSWAEAEGRAFLRFDYSAMANHQVALRMAPFRCGPMRRRPPSRR